METPRRGGRRKPDHEKKRHITLRLTDETRALVDELARAHGLTRTAMIEYLIHTYQPPTKTRHQ